MANGTKINYSEAAAARLAGLSVDELRSSRGNSSAKPTTEQEDWSSPGKPTKENTEEGWSYSTIGSKLLKKVQGIKAVPDKHIETKEIVVFPTAEQCEILQNHQEYRWYKDGMWQTFLGEIKGLSLTEDQRREEFSAICAEFLQADIEVLLKRGVLKNWEQFVSAKTKKPAVDVVPEGGFDDSAEIVVPEGKFDDTEAVLKNPETSAIVTEKAETKTEAKDWREVKREVEVDAVGDLHSNYIALVENLKTLGVAREVGDNKLEWAGGNRKLVMIGDILADRNTKGIDILLALDKLKKEAEAAGGHLDVLAGNHDDFFTSYLMGRGIAGGGNPVENSQLGDQGLGLLELADFGPDELKNYDWSKFQGERTFEKEINGKIEQVDKYDPVWELLQKHRAEILENMRKSEKGRKILEGLCEMKLAVIHDDNLFVHTDITPEMADFLLSRGNSIHEAVDFINERYQENLRKVLLEGQEPESKFDALRALFLYTNNRVNFDDVNERVPSHFTQAELANMPKDFFEKNEQERNRVIGEIPKTIEKFRKQGINAIFHGHSGVHAGKRIANPNFPVESIDLGSFKHSATDDRRSVLRVKIDGVLEKGTNTKLSTAAGKQMVEIRTL